jgi:uncharacterized protein YegP (UPF0339 family)
MKWLKKWLRRNTVEIEMFENRRGLWQWHIKAANGEKLAHSEEYSTYAMCHRTMTNLRGRKIR